MLHFHIVTTDYMFLYHIALKNKIWIDGAMWTSKTPPHPNNTPEKYK